MAHLKTIDPVENRRRMAAGELFYCFTPDLIAARKRCKDALDRFNDARNVSRRQAVALWRDIIDDKTPLPPVAATQEEDDALFEGCPWIDGPITKIDNGFNIKLGEDVYINAGSVWIDNGPIEIGARTLVGPTVSFYSGGHPVDPFVRQGTQGPEFGKPIKIGEDCWIGGNSAILPGVTIGRGVTVGAGSVVTKDVPDFVVVVGNPARILKKIDVSERPN